MNYYEILEVNERASSEVINMAYKALVKKYHPDIYDGDKEFANNTICMLNEAKEILLDPDKRKKYDMYLYSINQKKINFDRNNYNTYSYNSTKKNNGSKEREQEIKKEYIGKNSKKKIIYVGLISCIILIIIITNVISNNIKYEEALKEYTSGNYIEALSTFNGINPFKNSNQYVNECNYLLGKLEIENGDFLKASNYLRNCIYYNDSKDLLYSITINATNEFIEEKIKNLDAVGEYRNAKLQNSELKYQYALLKYKENKYDDALRYIDGIEQSNSNVDILRLLIKYKQLDNNLGTTLMNVNTKRSLLEEICKYDNIEGNDLEQLCYSATLDPVFDDVKLLGQWRSEDGFFDFIEDNGLKVSTYIKRVSDGQYYLFNVLDNDGIRKSYISNGDNVNGYTKSFRIEKFEGDNIIYPQRLYLYSYYFDKVIILEKNKYLVPNSTFSSSYFINISV